jgi:hypothetical protein
MPRLSLPLNKHHNTLLFTRVGGGVMFPNRNVKQEFAWRVPSVATE